MCTLIYLPVPPPTLKRFGDSTSPEMHLNVGGERGGEVMLVSCNTFCLKNLHVCVKYNEIQRNV